MAISAKVGDAVLRCYRDYVADLGEVRETDVYVGVGLVMSGLVLAVAGWGAFVWVELSGVDGSALWVVRELAFGSAAVGIPILLLGSIVALVGVGGLSRIAILGGVLCLVGVAVFAATYPDYWNVVVGVDYSPLGTTVYAAGIGMLLFSTGGAASCQITA